MAAVRADAGERAREWVEQFRHTSVGHEKSMFHPMDSERMDKYLQELGKLMIRAILWVPKGVERPRACFIGPGRAERARIDALSKATPAWHIQLIDSDLTVARPHHGDKGNVTLTQALIAHEVFLKIASISFGIDGGEPGRRSPALVLEHIGAYMSQIIALSKEYRSPGTEWVAKQFSHVTICANVISEVGNGVTSCIGRGLERLAGGQEALSACLEANPLLMLRFQIEYVPATGVLTRKVRIGCIESLRARVADEGGVLFFCDPLGRMLHPIKGNFNIYQDDPIESLVSPATGLVEQMNAALKCEPTARLIWPPTEEMHYPEAIGGHFYSYPIRAYLLNLQKAEGKAAEPAAAAGAAVGAGAGPGPGPKTRNEPAAAGT